MAMIVVKHHVIPHILASMDISIRSPLTTSSALLWNLLFKQSVDWTPSRRGGI